MQDLEMDLVDWHTQLAGRDRRKAHVLWVMSLVGCLVLVPWFMMFWLAPATTSQPKSVKPIGTNAVSHGGRPSVG